ncbi:glycoside hydrolase family 3 protein [Georgenia sp. SUBG003]|uniref:glycoside hydrolase family 3 protein n=1 Tax=Georgenia sp. SUBG003 TaxID=1497974 RepID=UPI0004D584E7|nr:hypothetical protein DA06_09560 [Georgenia sp. SUBG003]
MRRRLLAPVLALCLGPALALPAGAAAETDYPFRDIDLPLEERVEDLLSRLTLEEKVSLMHQWQPAIERLDVPAFRTGTEALHGVAWLGEATVFPQAIGLASTWDPELLEDVGEAVGTEVRGFHTLDRWYHGLNVWAPVVDPLRDPRWGRNEEGYSEDPTLTGAMSIGYTDGLQGDHPDYLLSAPLIKHFLGYNNEVDRDRTSSSLPPRLLNEYYLKFFEPALAAGTANGIMASYNLVNGRPAHLLPEINDKVREWAPEEVLVVSDAYAPGNVVDSQGYYDTHAESHAALVKAGVDSFTDRGEDPSFTTANLTAALDQGLLTEADLDEALGHTLSIRFRLGDFDPEGANPYADITADVINDPEHAALARQAAAEQMTLLKNDGEALPMAGDGTVAVVGPLGDTLYEDWYAGTMPYKVTAADGLAERLGAENVTTSEGVDRIALREAGTGRYVTAGTDDDGEVLTASAPTAGAAEGLDVFDWGEGVVALRTTANGKYVSLGGSNRLVNDQVQPNGWVVQQTFNLVELDDGTTALRHVANGRFVTVDGQGRLAATARDEAGAARFEIDTVRDGQAEAVEVAGAADTVVMVVGNNPYINGRETQDRTDITLPAAQEELLRAVTAANKDVVLVVMSSYPIAIPWAQENVPAIVWTSHAGQETGNALADVLLGDVSPAGRLTQTWYRSVDELPDILEYDIARSGMTYQYYEGDPLYPFGHGLSYADFEYGEVSVSSRTAKAGDTVTVSVDVTNTSGVDGDEVVQLYTRALDAPVPQPLKQLRSFERVHVPAGETVTVDLEVAVEDLAYWDVESESEVVAAGRYEVLVGASSEDVRGTAELRVPGSQGTRSRDLSSEPVAVKNFDDYSGVEMVDTTKVDGTAVGASEGDWVAFHDVRLRGGDAKVEVVASREDGGVATLEVRLGSPDGTLAGTLEVPSTGDRYEYVTVEAALDAAGGPQDVYLVARGDMRLDTVQLTR